jgi:hypothetical protein
MKLQVPFVQLPLLFDADTLAREVSALGAAPWREHPQKFPGNFALPLISVDGDPDSDAVAGRMRPTEYLEQCPYLMQVLASLRAVWGRTRLMKLSGQAEVTSHADINYYWRERVRVHVPILTTPTVRFLCGDAEVNMQPGECWIFDTWRQHRVINAADDERIHLVADTIGSVEFWDLVGQGRAPGHGAFAGWRADSLPARAGARPELHYESVNVPDVMTPWELREHLGFLMRDLVPGPQSQLVQRTVARFQSGWHALWAEHGPDRAAWPAYRAMLDEFDRGIARVAQSLQLVNGTPFVKALRGMVLNVALADAKRSANADEPRAPAGQQRGAP